VDITLLLDFDVKTMPVTQKLLGSLLEQ